LKETGVIKFTFMISLRTAQERSSFNSANKVGNSDGYRKYGRTGSPVEEMSCPNVRNAVLRRTVPSRSVSVPICARVFECLKSVCVFVCV
jgi:hypothetical protein